MMFHNCFSYFKKSDLILGDEVKEGLGSQPAVLRGYLFSERGTQKDIKPACLLINVVTGSTLFCLNGPAETSAKGECSAADSEVEFQFR